MGDSKTTDEKAPEAPEPVEEAAAVELDGVDPYEANGVPDEGLHGNADY